MWKRIRPESEGSGSLGVEEHSNRLFVILRLIISALPTETWFLEIKSSWRASQLMAAMVICTWAQSHCPDFSALK